MGRKILVVYQSKTGFTQRYAQMIGEELGCAVLPLRDTSAAVLSKYDIVVFGSRAHAGRIDSYTKAKKMFEKSGAGHFVLFVTGATPNEEEQAIKAFWKQNLSEDEQRQIPHFYFQSGLCYEKMSLPDKMMMKMAAAMMKKEKGQGDAAQRITSSYDISSQMYCEPLLSFLGEKEKENGR